MTPLALRYAWRELRGGLRGFGVFIACIALGVMAIAGVGSVAQSLADGLSRAGSVILGGDLAFSLVQREANDGERAFLDAHGAVAAVATLPTMARAGDGRTTLVEIKAVDDAYPLFGAVDDRARHAAARRCSRARRRRFGAAADPALLTRLDLKLGDRITIGKATIELRAAYSRTSRTDLSGGISFGPRLLVSQAALRASELLQPGSLVRWQYRLRLPAGRLRATSPLPRSKRRRAHRVPECRLGHPHAQQGVAAARTQCRALQSIPHARRLDRACWSAASAWRTRWQAISRASATSSRP